MLDKSKIASLHDAVHDLVSDGDTVHFVFSHNRSHAAAWELARQFRDRQSLRLVATGLLEYASVLCAAGAISELEGAFAGNTYPSPAPSRVLIEQINSATGNDPHWTNLTVTLRLMASALGMPFVPSTSLAGSNLAIGPNRAVARDPFTDRQVTLLAPLTPDVAFVHAALADEYGNAVVYGPDAEHLWGAYAAKKVIVTAEKIVSHAELKSLGPRPGLFGHCVDAVVATPFGAHPQAQFVWHSADADIAYAEDYEFRQNLRDLSKNYELLREWVEEWIFNSDHDSYIKKLGTERLHALQDMNPPAFEQQRYENTTEEEKAAVVAMRQSVKLLSSSSHSLIFAGIGLSHIAAWAAEKKCREDGHHVELVAETGMYGFTPYQGDPYLFNYPNALSSTFHSGFIQLLGALAGPRARNVLVLLAAAQVDKYGNINSSMGSNNKFIVGSGGANDLVSGGGDYIVVMPLKLGRLVSDLPFITSPVGNLLGIATNYGFFTPSGAEGELEVDELILTDKNEQETLAEIRNLCGWDIKASKTMRVVRQPDIKELCVLRSFDPARVILS